MMPLHLFRQSWSCNVLTSFRMCSFEGFGAAADTDEKKTMEHVNTMRSLLAIMFLQVGCTRLFLHSPGKERSERGSSARNQQEIHGLRGRKGRDASR